DIYDSFSGKTYHSKDIIKTARLDKFEYNHSKGDIRVAYEELLILRKEGELPTSAADYYTYHLGELALQFGEYELTKEIIVELTEFYKSRNNRSIVSGHSTQVMPIYL